MVIMATTRQLLEERFPYQFADPHLGIAIAYGWSHIVVRLCEDVDAALGVDKRDFHWTQIKEKAGACRLNWMAAGKHSLLDQEGKDVVLTRIRDLVKAAEERTQKTCAVCGAPGELDLSQPWVLTLCPEHSAAHAQGKLPPVFPAS